MTAIGIRELEKGDMVKCNYTIEGVETTGLLRYGGMDGGLYARLYTDDGIMMNAGGKVVKVGDHYERAKKE